MESKDPVGLCTATDDNASVSLQRPLSTTSETVVPTDVGDTGLSTPSHLSTARRQGHPHPADVTARSPATPVTCLSTELMDRPPLERLSLRQLTPLTPRKGLTFIAFLMDVTNTLTEAA